MDSGLRFEQSEERPALRGLSVFLSTSIPDADRWEGTADSLEITDAVVAFARAFLSAGLRIVSAAHPTIAPLLLYVAAELPIGHANRVAIYQSQLFEPILPAATRRFESDGTGEVIWTPAVDGERPVPGEWNKSLRIMRDRMLRETNPAAAVFVGGMDGILEEFALFTEQFPGRPTYPVSRPGGEARHLFEGAEDRQDFLAGDVYPTIWRAVLDDLEARR